MCEAMDLLELRDDARFAGNQDRVARRAELIPQLSRAMQTRTTAEWLEIFDRADVPAAPVNTISEALREPQLAANDMIQAVEHPAVGTIHVSGSAFRFRDTDTRVRRHPPMLGEHNREVLGDLLGYDEARIARLQREGVI
jgi:crotonobetainyl-CoA:carnitine CoA-transferase CaiB-like acyl-CoA transferase